MGVGGWETQGLLNPELPVEGRSRKETNFDLVELRLIKSVVVGQGVTIPSLQEKLEGLQTPYYYDPDDAFWDSRDKAWKSRSELVLEQFSAVRDELQANTAKALESLLPGEPEKISKALLDLVREPLGGKALLKKRGRGRPRTSG